MEGFEVTKIGKHIFCILDAGNSSFYMVEGDKKAAVIDTGITTGKKITPLLRELTDKPLLLVATHVHCDHIYHMDEFEEVYMCHDEKKIEETTLRTYQTRIPLDRLGQYGGKRWCVTLEHIGILRTCELYSDGPLPI